MSRRVAQPSGFRIVIALITCVALIPLPNIASLVSEAAQDQAEPGAGSRKGAKQKGWVIAPDTISERCEESLRTDSQ